MTITFMRKTSLVVSAIVIGIVMCLSVWLVLREHRADSTSAPERSTHPDNKPAIAHVPQPTQHSEKQRLDASRKAAQSIADMLKSNYHESGVPNPNMEKLIEIMETPAFATYLENSSNTQREWNDFLESHGYPVNRDVFSKAFRNTFPTGTPADYEPEMRVKIAQMFLATEPLDPQDAEESLLQRARVIAELMSPDTEESGRAWFVGQFGEDWDGAIMEAEGDNLNNPAFVWITDVQTNAASIVAQAKTASPEPATRDSARPWDMSSITDSPDTADSLPEVPASPEPAANRELMTDAETDEALTPRPSNTPDSDGQHVPDEIQSSIEASLKSQFSSERFERAMSTLERYGEEDGLRRLRENDPEVAKQIERHRNRSRSEDFDKSEEEVSR